jgi:uncharacterized protein with PQ loop repeat
MAGFIGFHHFHLRKRIHKKNEIYPHPDPIKRFIDKSIFFVGLVGPIMTIPQITKIFLEKNAAGISIISWIAYFFTSFFWLAYGVIHKEKPIIVTYFVWLILDVFIIVGTLMYG